jgi:DUF4097 and DUF4098 domain-containing protein YvlB
MKHVIILFTCIALAVSFLTADEPAEKNAKTSKSFTVQKSGTLEVNVVGDITIKTWDKAEVFVKANGIDEEDLEELTMEQSGNTVSVIFKPDWNISGNVEFTISLPEQFNAEIATSGGNIEVGGSLKGTLSARTSGGNISVQDIGGKTSLRTSGGNISLGSVNDEAVVSTSGGNIEVIKVAKKLDAKTSGGNIEVGEVGGSASVSTSGGNIDVKKVSGSAVLKTAGGNIELAGASGRVEARTAGGDIELTNITGSVEAKTAGGNVSAEMNPAGQGKSELATAGGDVTIVLPANAKATVEATIRIDRWKRESDRYDIHSDFEAADYKKDEKRRGIYGRYEINGGGEKITLSTSMGDIYIKKAGK